MEQYWQTVRHSARGSDCVPVGLPDIEVERWLLHAASKERELLLALEEFVWRMVAAGLPIDRSGLYIGTLHPLLRGFAWTWRRSDGSCDELKVGQGVIATESARRSPLWKLFATGQALRCCPQDPQVQSEFPIMLEYASMGFTDYVAILLGEGRFRHAFAYATMRPQRFTVDEIARVERLVTLFSLHVQRHIAVRIADGTLRTYLGSLAAGKVLSGKIKRGAGEAVHAIIWFSDLRDFTMLSDERTSPEVIQLINFYFEIFADAVLSHGGEVLKFLGDGLLAIFPFVEGADCSAIAEAALAAAEQAQDKLDNFNKRPPVELTETGDWSPLRAGIALHEGEVFFGNVGAVERLDFTVIGPAVSETSRIESLNKSIGNGILISALAARRINRPLTRLGEFPIRGVPRRIEPYEPIQMPGAVLSEEAMK